MAIGSCNKNFDWNVGVEPRGERSGGYCRERAQHGSRLVREFCAVAAAATRRGSFERNAQPRGGFVALPSSGGGD